MMVVAMVVIFAAVMMFHNDDNYDNSNNTNNNNNNPPTPRLSACERTARSSATHGSIQYPNVWFLSRVTIWLARIVTARLPALLVHASC